MTCIRRQRVLGLVIASVALVALVAPSRALAGTYIVEACGNGPNLTWQGSASPGWVAEDNCNRDGTGNLSVGIPDSSASVPSGSSASYQLAAPSGATIDWIEPNFRIAYVSRYGAELGVFRSDQPGRIWGCDNFNPEAFCGGQFTQSTPHVDTGGAGAVRIQAGCIYEQGCSGGGDIKLFTRAVKAQINDGTAPTVSIQGGGLSGATGWVSGVQSLTWSASDNVGIGACRHTIDGGSLGDGSLRDCGSYNLTCPNLDSGQYLTYNTGSLPDGPHIVTAEAVDRAGNGGSASATFYSDNHAPTPPLNLSVDGGDGWRSKPGFLVTWANPADEVSKFSGLRRALYSMCRVRTGECVSGASSDPLSPGHPVSSTVVTVPRQGDWTLSMYLQDYAGNADPNGSRAVHLRYDDAPPSSVVFANVDPGDPRHLSVAVDDAGSGLGSGEIDYRPAGADTWTSLPTRVEGDVLVASIDDETLARGHYDLRAIAHDQAGLTTIGDKRKDGSSAAFDIPLRVPVRLVAGFSRVKHTRKHGRVLRRRVLVPTRKVRFGRQARISGKLMGEADGRPLANVSLEVAARPHMDRADWSLGTTVQTDGEGRFRYGAPPGPSRDLRFRYPGTQTLGAASQQVALLVPASSNIRADRHLVRNGDTVTLSGRIRGVPPPAGKLVAVQGAVRGHWRTFANAHTNGNGVWRTTYRFETVTRRFRFRFRVRIPRETTFPYQSGGSRQTVVIVKP